VTPSSPVDFTQLVSEFEIVGGDEEETRQLRALLSDARYFVGEFPWCESVREAFLGFGIDGLVGVVLVRIQPGSDGIDEWLWIVVGDLPPLYLVTDLSPTPAAALRTYIGLCQEWVDAVNAGRSVEDFVPIDAPPDAEHADMLERRLRFLATEVLPEVSSRPETS
jgi:hypothetical protein